MKIILLDLVFISLIIGLSVFLISFYLPAENINVTYPDWMVQAFRIREIQLHGITSWTHTWSNGINLWKSYQIVPHLITLAVADIFRLEITRAMIVMVIAQFIFLRIITYIVARLLKFSPFTALVAALATFSIAYFWKAVGDYTLLFSFSFFPIILLLWVKYLEGKFQWIYPYIAGLMFYIHPVFGLISISLWGVAKLIEDSQLFSLRTLLQCLVFLAASSFFWVPVAFKDSYTNSTVYIATKEFLQLALAPFPYYGLSFILLIYFFIGFVQQFFPISSVYRWGKILTLYVFAYFSLIYIGTHVSLPNFINQFQYTRGVGLLGICIIFAALPFVEQVQKTNSLFFRGLLVTAVTITFVEGTWITSNYSPSVHKNISDPVTSFMQQKKIDNTEGRIWTPTIDLSSYYGATYSLHFPTSYMAQLESNHLPERLNQLITYQPFLNQIPSSDISRIDNYFMLAGIQYVFFDEDSSFVQALLDKKSGYKHLGQVVTPSGIYEAFETPWTARNAVLVSNKYRDDLITFPTNMQFDLVPDQVALDNKVKEFSTMVYDPSNNPLFVTYPTEESLALSIPTKRTSSFVLINESFDQEWQAYFKGEKQSITSVGPNFMLVTLANQNDGGKLILYHTWPLYYYLLLFIVITVPLVIGFGPFILNKKEIVFRHLELVKRPRGVLKPSFQMALQVQRKFLKHFIHR